MRKLYSQALNIDGEYLGEAFDIHVVVAGSVHFREF
jgi:hypothetical protein